MSRNNQAASLQSGIHTAITDSLFRPNVHSVPHFSMNFIQCDIYLPLTKNAHGESKRLIDYR